MCLMMLLMFWKLLTRQRWKLLRMSKYAVLLYSIHTYNTKLIYITNRNTTNKKY